MAVPIWQLKCDYILNLDEKIHTFFNVLDIFDDESVNTIHIFRNKKMTEPK